MDKSQAQAEVEKSFPDATIKTWAKYNDLFLFRMEWPSEAEKDWDPFVSVDPVTKQVRDFSVITDGNLSEISALDWKEV